MRAIEEKIEIPESRKEDFRREIMNYIGALAIDGKPFSSAVGKADNHMGIITWGA